MTLDARSDARRQYEPMSPAERRARVLRRRRAGAADLLGIGSAAQTPTGAELAADAGPAPPVSISTSLEPRALQESVHATDGFVGVDAIDDDMRTMPMKRREATHERFCERATIYGVPKSDYRSATRLVSDLARSGSVSRRLQHIEPPLIQDTGIAIYGGAEFFRGSPEREGCALLAPAQTLYVASKFGDDAANVKTPRKARGHRGTAPSAPALIGAHAPAPHKGKGKGKNKECKPDAGPGALEAK